MAVVADLLVYHGVDVARLLVLEHVVEDGLGVEDELALVGDSFGGFLDELFCVRVELDACLFFVHVLADGGFRDAQYFCDFRLLLSFSLEVLREFFPDCGQDVEHFDFLRMNHFQPHELNYR